MIPSRKFVFGRKPSGFSPGVAASTNGPNVLPSSVDFVTNTWPTRFLLFVSNPPTNATYSVPSLPTEGITNVVAGVVIPGGVIVTAFENVWPRSRDTASRILPLPAAPLNVSPRGDRLVGHHVRSGRRLPSRRRRRGGTHHRHRDH